MSRNWGIPSKDGIRRAKDARPILTLLISLLFGVFAASLAVISFSDARTSVAGLFHGITLVFAVVASGFGCWAYIYFAWPRLAAQFTGGDAFSDLLRFFARAVVGLVVLYAMARGVAGAGYLRPGVLILCVCGGAAAAAAFQTVVTFVPPIKD